MRRVIVLLLIMLLFVVGCESDPVPDGGGVAAGLVENGELVAAADTTICESVQVSPVDAGHVAVDCINVPTPQSTDTPAPTGTATSTPTLTPTHTHEPPTTTPTFTPTATGTAAATLTPTSGPVAGQVCPAWVHDGYVTTGPDGNSYPTWHPSVDPTYGCYFQHEHGDNPANHPLYETANANNLLTFGYVGAVANSPEGHPGFKVFTYLCGEQGDQGANRVESIWIMHMGTSGTMRFHMPFHSITYIGRACNGTWEVRLQGMADFGSEVPIGSVCDNPRQGGRDFATLGCADRLPLEASRFYEIWSTGIFQIVHPNDPFTGLFQSRLYLSLIPAAFDPVTVVDPNDLNRVLYSATLFGGDPFSTNSDWLGLKREAYQGPISINNGGSRPTAYVTDAYGKVLLGVPSGSPGTLTQYVSNSVVSGTASNMSANGSQFKKLFDYTDNPHVVPPN